MLHDDVKNFSQQASSTPCPLHPAAPSWLPIGQPDNPTNYRCSQCSPPPAKAFIAKTLGNCPPSLVDAAAHAQVQANVQAQAQYTPCPPRTIAYEQPACPSCHGFWITEIDQPDRLMLRCHTCKREVEPAELQALLSQPKSINTRSNCSPASQA